MIRFLTDSHICTETALEVIQNLFPLMEEKGNESFQNQNSVAYLIMYSNSKNILKEE